MRPAVSSHPVGLDRRLRFHGLNFPDDGFALAVLTDVGSRYPIAGKPLISSGYGWGALMAGRLTCDDVVRIDGRLLVSGAFPSDTPCGGRLARISHVHGTSHEAPDTSGRVAEVAAGIPCAGLAVRRGRASAG